MKKSSFAIGVAVAALTMVAAVSGASADDTKISGRMYADFTNIDQKVDGVQTAPSGTGFDIKRLYIGIDHTFNDMFSANVTTDFQYSSAISSTEVYLKKAYVQAKFSDALVVRVGATDLPWVPYAEGIYGYRYVENTVADRTKFATSSDWGLHAAGDLGQNFSYAVAAINGNGYKNPTRSKSMDFEGRLSAKFDQLNFAIGGYTGKLGQDVPGVATPNTATRFNALAAYVGDRSRFGVEYFSANDYSAALVKDPLHEDKADGVSVFGSYRVTPIYTIFGRAEEVKPSKTLSPTKKDQYYNAGVSFAAFKGVSFSAVVKHDEVTSIGHKTTNNEVGIWTEVRY
ncbi:hypothetical protein AEAC466_07045 [Asticcacaulis sp. AC466]|uniref:porin n=1 Tax=Asticcacaulis sp. AC466 TaxID=1282362 RepID=UPI0003C3FE70|nr:porin [Asticcacaulis sp. AC466]ESQ84807.1 hypothetical protein AEAC466_07045 [Asticcacaulis sp. AC466]